MVTAASDYDEPWKEVCDTRFQRVLELSCPDLVADIDWTRPIQFLNTELQTLAPAAKVGRQHVDHLARVLWKPTGSRALIHTEVQSQVELPLGHRVFEYSTSLRKIHGLDVISLVLLADPNPRFRPWRYLRQLGGCRHEFEFRTCKFLDFDPDFLDASTNPVAKVVLAQRLAQETARNPRARLEGKLRWMDRILTQEFPEADQRILLRALDWMNPLPEELAIEFQREVREHPSHKIMPYYTSFEESARKEALAIGRSQGRTEGRNEGRTEGRNEGQLLALRAAIKDLFRDRFGFMPVGVGARLETESDPQVLRAWLRRVAAIDTHEAFLTLLGITRS
ncbi:MAG: hypothetical protein RLZ45_3240 [Verrucomicrobiota bacterium]|jgi:hypothetical protein